jgi:arabinose-5-phosphate isomerase
MNKITDHLTSARRTFDLETRAIESTIKNLDASAFESACKLLLDVSGRVVVTGVGKSGHIANKIASTLSSTGTPAYFLHPSEAAHGDMGMVRKEDIIIMLSKSGSSEELFTLLPTLMRIGIRIIAITCFSDSKLAEAARQSGGVVLLITCEEEACPHDLAPTASTTATLVLGDALAVALLEARQFSSKDFAMLHPAGALGRKLTLQVCDLMAGDSSVPSVSEDASLTRVMLEMSAKRVGATAVLRGGRLAGIITDGDLRRFFQSRETVDVNAVQAKDVMKADPRTIREDVLAIEALKQMEESPKVMQLLVMDASEKLVGVLHMHDIVRAGIS